MLSGAWSKTKEEYLKLRQAPPWRQYLIAFCILFGAVYFAWSVFWRPALTPEGFTPAKPAVPATKEDGPVIKVPIKVVPAKAVKRKFPMSVKKESEEWVDTAEVPPAPNGAVVLTKIDTVTGESTSEVALKAAPWFAFERNNTLGAGYEVGTQGTKIPVYYRRDVLRVKDVHLIGEVGGKLALDPTEKSEAYGKIGVEWRF